MSGPGLGKFQGAPCHGRDTSNALAQPELAYEYPVSVPRRVARERRIITEHMHSSHRNSMSGCTHVKHAAHAPKSHAYETLSWTWSAWYPAVVALDEGAEER
eukprot:3458179-Rhodomonas_salina.2